MDLKQLSLLENPTKRICCEWLYDRYKEQRIDSLKRADSGFYQTKEWIQLREKVFDKLGCRCLKCGSEDFLHIDHIKPRSLYPELELEIDNMQVLCRVCNIGKSNRNEIDYRPVI